MNTENIIHQERIIILNIYVPNVGAPNYIENTTYLQAQIDSNTTVGDFNTKLILTNCSSRPTKFYKKPLKVNEHDRPNELNQHLEYFIHLLQIHILFSSP
jgi:hypothetical protein